MTRASTSRVTRVEHRFHVPEDGDMKDLGIAVTWATEKARELGIDTSYDNWAHFLVEDEGFAIVVVEDK